MRTLQTFDIEYMLIGSFLVGGLTPDAREVISWFDAKMLQNYKLAEVYQAIVKQSRKDDLIDMMLLSNDYALTFSELADIANNTFSSANLTGYAKKLRELWINREAKKQFVQIAKQLGKARTDEQTETIISKALETMKTLLADNVDTKPVAIADLLESYLDVFEKRTQKDFSQRLLKTGLSGLDAILGGINPNDLVIVAGRPSMGKTELGLTMAKNVIEAKGSVLFFSLEMGNIQLADRLVSAGANVSVTKLRTATGLDDGDWSRISEYIGEATEHNLFFVDRSGLTAEQITAIAEKQIANTPLSAIFIDYLGLIHHVPTDNMVYKIAETTKTLKNFAKRFNVPIILLCQLNRNLEQRADKRPISADLRESGSIEQDADSVIMLYREKVYKRNSNNHYSEAIVTKNRFGQTGTAYMLFEHGHFFDCDQVAAQECCAISDMQSGKTKSFKDYAGVGN